MIYRSHSSTRQRKRQDVTLRSHSNTRKGKERMLHWGPISWLTQRRKGYSIDVPFKPKERKRKGCHIKVPFQPKVRKWKDVASRSHSSTKKERILHHSPQGKNKERKNLQMVPFQFKAGEQEPKQERNKTRQQQNKGKSQDDPIASTKPNQTKPKKCWMHRGNGRKDVTTKPRSSTKRRRRRRRTTTSPSSTWLKEQPICLLLLKWLQSWPQSGNGRMAHYSPLPAPGLGTPTPDKEKSRQLQRSTSKGHTKPAKTKPYQKTNTQDTASQPSACLVQHENFRQNTTAPGVPKWSLNSVLVGPNHVSLPSSDGIGCFRSGLTVACHSTTPRAQDPLLLQK